MKLTLILLALTLLAPMGALRAVESPAPGALNVILIVTDDQGYGDYGFMGNPHLRTPHLDRMAASSPRVDRFYVSPVCSPMRAALMTGRYAYRTGVIATNGGQSEMDSEETTVAEVLRANGYFTGIYGKWHLGDQAPRRPQDQGFEEALVHRGGGLAQGSDPPENEDRYTDPILFHNGAKIATRGFCTDVYFRYAREAVARSQQARRPFFLYIATNAPHDPYHDVPDDPYRFYRSIGQELVNFPTASGHFPIENQGEMNAPDRIARIYAMVENIDTNVGALLDDLERRNLLSSTLVVFMSDNGGRGRRYSAGLRGEKSEVYEGGIRSPLLLSLQGRLSQEVRIHAATAHIDVFPTLLSACGIAHPRGVSLDGLDLWPLLTGQMGDSALAGRTLFLQSHWGSRPDLYRNAAVIRGEWKLVSNTRHTGALRSGIPPFELFNLREDPNEKVNVMAVHPRRAETLQVAYEDWFYAVTARRFGPPVIEIGTAAEPEVVLTQMERWAARTDTWSRREGDWRVKVSTTARFRLTPVPRPRSTWEEVTLWIPELQEQPLVLTKAEGSESSLGVRLVPGVYTIRATMKSGGKIAPLHQLSITSDHATPP